MALRLVSLLLLTSLILSLKLEHLTTHQQQFYLNGLRVQLLSPQQYQRLQKQRQQQQIAEKQRHSTATTIIAIAFSIAFLLLILFSIYKCTKSNNNSPSEQYPDQHDPTYDYPPPQPPLYYPQNSLAHHGNVQYPNEHPFPQQPSPYIGQES